MSPRWCIFKVFHPDNPPELGTTISSHLHPSSLLQKIVVGRRQLGFLTFPNLQISPFLWGLYNLHTFWKQSLRRIDSVSILELPKNWRQSFQKYCGIIMNFWERSLTVLSFFLTTWLVSPVCSVVVAGVGVAGVVVVGVELRHVYVRGEGCEGGQAGPQLTLLCHHPQQRPHPGLGIRAVNEGSRRFHNHGRGPY